MKADVEVTRMSSKGQIVIPKALRQEFRLMPGETFAVFGRGDTLILKKIRMPSPKETFNELSKWGREFAKEKGFKEESVDKKIHKHRSVNR